MSDEETFPIELDTFDQYVAAVVKRFPLASASNVARLATCERQLEYHEAILANYPGSAQSENAYLKLVPIWCRLVGGMGAESGSEDGDITPVRRRREF